MELDLFDHGPAANDGPPPRTLADGRVVGGSSEEWRFECEARHVGRLQGINHREYMAHVERRRGAEYAAALTLRIRAVLLYDEACKVVAMDSLAARRAYLDRIENKRGADGRRELECEVKRVWGLKAA